MKKKKLRPGALALRNIKQHKKQYTAMAAGIILALVFASGFLYFFYCYRASAEILRGEEYGLEDCIIMHTNEKAVDDLQAQGMLINALNDFESRMDYRYVPGVEQFLDELRAGDYPAAIVTSSNRDKMRNVYRAHPEIKSLFTHIFTGEDFTRSKPAPDCYLLGMEVFGTLPERTFIFEDSFNGLQAAKDSGGKVIALATTNSRQDVSPYADLVIDDFVGMSLPLLFQML